MSAVLEISKFGEIDGHEIKIFKVEYPGFRVSIINYGGIIKSIETADYNGRIRNIILGYETLEEYIKDDFYIGTVIGRFANRIEEGKFTIDNKDFIVSQNKGSHHLHGGFEGFNKKIWSIEEAKVEDEHTIIKLLYQSPDGEEGYPGNLKTFITYSISTNEINIKYESSTDKETIINLTHHTYFNLSGRYKQNIFDHLVRISADEYIPVKEDGIPLDHFNEVEKTSFDFRKLSGLNPKIFDDNQQLKNAQGYDHCFILKNQQDAAEIYHPETKRHVHISTNYPGIQLYTGNDLNNPFSKHVGLCLETQFFPNSPNRKDYPDVVLKPKEKYTMFTTYKFSADD